MRQSWVSVFLRIEARSTVFTFLQRLFAPETPAAIAERHAATAALANLAPLHGPLGAAEAARALAAVSAGPPGSVFFLAAPETAGHRDGVRELLRGLAADLPPGRTAVVVFDAAAEQLSALSLAAEDAADLVKGTADAIEMLAITLPAAFQSDSYRVSRLALDEELRSGHDTAIDALKQRATKANIGLLHTPHGYAIAPIHDGRVVAPEVVKALPEALKTEVDNKLAAFEAELNRALADRAELQQAYAAARRDLDRDTASLAVHAALARLYARFAALPEIKAYLDGLAADLIRNAALFCDPSDAAGAAGFRAPADLAADPRLARFRAAPASPAAAPAMGVVRLRAFDRASLIGEIRKPVGSPPTPACVEAGCLTRAGRGYALVSIDDLAADSNAWPLLRQPLRAGSAAPMLDDGGRPRISSLELPVACRVLITGSASQYEDWCAKDPAVREQVTLITLFEAALERTPDAEHQFARHAAAIAADLKLPPLDGETLGELLAARTLKQGRVQVLSTDLGAVRAFLSAQPPRAPAPAVEPATPAAEADAAPAARKAASPDTPAAAQPIRAAA